MAASGGSEHDERARLVDAHCHVDLYPSYSAILDECERSLTDVLAVTTSPRAYPGNMQRAARSKHVTVALGLHPQLVREEAGQLEAFEALLLKVKVVGEVGLDASPRFYASFDEQRRVFARIIRSCSAAGGRPISVHSVRSAAHVLRILQDEDPSGRNVVALHWFSGAQSLAKAAVELGCFFSINEAMLSTTRGIALVGALPPRTVLTESDGPFIERDGRPLTPSMVSRVLARIAELWKTDPNSAATLIHENFDRFIAGSRPHDFGSATM